MPRFAPVTMIESGRFVELPTVGTLPVTRVCGRRRSSLVIAFVAALAAALPLRAALAPLTLVEDGRPRAVIVVPAEGMPADRVLARAKDVRTHAAALATAELVEYLQKSTGAVVSVQLEGAPVDTAKFPVRIYLGACAENGRLVSAKPLQPEEYVIRTTPTTLHLFGGDTTSGGTNCAGTLNAVYTFLGDAMGVRWLFPGALGEVVPRRTTLAIATLDRREQPPVAKRKIRDAALTREQIFAPLLKQWGVPMDEWKRTFSLEVNGPWFRRQRLGARVEIEGGHSYGGYYEKYAKDHPDFFALQPDGTRQQVPVRERLCVSNPELWDFVARLRIEELKADPTRQTISIAPNDGGANKFCMCDRCRSWDPPEAPKVTKNTALIDPATRKPFPEYPSLSDRYFRYFNEVARRVRAELPDRSVVTYAYSVYRTPPVRVKQLEPNLIVGYVGLKLADIDAWSKVAPKLVIRPNELGPMIELGLPRNAAPFLAHAVKYAVEHHAIAFDFDNCHGNWGGHGLDYYVLAQSLWNPDLNVREVIADYCRAAYGPGAPAMLRYFGQLENITDAVRADDKMVARGTEANRLLRYYTPAALGDLEAAVAEARRAIGTTDASCLARLAMTEDSLKYARLLTSLLEASTGANYRKSKLHQERLALVTDFMKETVLTQSIASMHSLRYLRIALANGELEDQ